MAAHAKYFGASAAHRWMKCPAAPRREEPYPNKGSTHAREGTAAHTLMEWTLLSPAKDAAAFTGREIEVEGETFTVDAVMAGYVQVVVDYCVNVLAADPDAELFVETRVCYRPYLSPEVQGDEEEGFGTADVILISKDEIIVVDLKYGQGKKVSAQDNEQLLLYALGAYEEYSLVYDLRRVRVVIGQPRAGGISEATYTVDELLAFGETARAASIAVLSPNPKGNPGEEQCRWCRAKASCPDLAHEALAAAFGDFDDLDAAQPRPVKDVDLVACYRKLPLIAQWSEAIAARMVEDTGAGLVPGWKLVEGRKGHRAWDNPEEVEAELLATLPAKLVYTRKLVSPTEAEKLLKEERPRVWKRLSARVTQPAGKPVPAPESDRRPALGTDFSNLNDESDLI